MKRTITLLLLLIIAPLVAFAQDKPQPQANNKPVKAGPSLPEEVTIDREASRKVLEYAKDIRIAQLEVEKRQAQLRETQLQIEILQLKNEQALRELEAHSKHVEILTDESKAAYQRAAIKAGIPGDDIERYEGRQQPDGTIKLRRKAAPSKK